MQRADILVELQDQSAASYSSSEAIRFSQFIERQISKPIVAPTDLAAFFEYKTQGLNRILAR